MESTVPRSLARVGARLATLLSAGVLLAAIPACTTTPPLAGCGPCEAEIADAMERYQDAARAVDPDRMAAFYTTAGVLLEPGIPPIQGRQAIRDFIASFPGVRVEVATATPESIEVCGDTGVLWGEFFERLAFPGQPVSEQRGKFVIQWRRQGGQWLIDRFYRLPITTAEFPPAAPDASPAR